MDRKNLGINFDPANLIMYGSAIPSRRSKCSTSICSRFTARTAYGRRRSRPARLGLSGRSAKAQVGMDKFIAKLKQVGYKGIAER